MAWCVEPTWPIPTTEQLFISFVAPYTGNLDDTTWPIGSTLEDMVAKFNGVEGGPYVWSVVDGCLCVESPPGQAPVDIKWAHGEGNDGTDVFFEKEEEVELDPELQACLDCFELVFGCSLLDLIPEDEELQKAAIVAAIQAGLTEPGEPEPVSTSATIVGTVLAEDWAGNAWSPTDGVGDMVAPINPACGPPDWGALVVDLNLPAGTTVGSTAQTTFNVLDAGAGWGTTYVFDKSTGAVLGQTYPPGAGGQGNNAPLPIVDTVSFTVPADPTAVCLVVAAFGHAGSWEETDCDEIGPGETIVTVAPHPCGPALACLEEMFGCSLADMIDAAGVLKDDVVPAYGLIPGAPGVRNREWIDTKPAIAINASDVENGSAFRLAHDFSLAPDIDTVTATPVVNDTNGTAQQLDIQVLDTFITVPAGGVWLQLAGGSEGYWAIELGECCGPLVFQTHAAFTGSIVSPTTPVFIGEGQHKLRIWNIDSGGTNSSQSDNWSVDGETFSAAIPPGVTFGVEKSEWDCIMVPQCEPAPDGYSFHAPLPCVSGFTDPLPQINEAILPELEVPDIEFTPTNLEIVQATLLQDTWEERDAHGNLMAVTFNTRTRVTQAAGNGWGWLNVPLVAGFQQPQILEVGAYRAPSVTPQADDGANGAAPRGPFMGSEYHHWSSTNRLYSGYFRREVDLVGTYVSAVVRYVRS